VKKIILLMLCIFIASCDTEIIEETCPERMIVVGDECCPDKNDNDICDENEAKKENEIVSYTSLADVESGINRSFYPLKLYNFSYFERENVTGIENTFDIRASNRFNILKMKQEYDYIKTSADFSSFVHRLFDLTVKNNKIAANSLIEYNQLFDTAWNDVVTDYNHTLEEISILGKDAFIERHILLFDREGSLIDIGDVHYTIKVFCTPELVVTVYPSESWGLIYSPGNTLNVMKKKFDDLNKKEHEGMIQAAEKVVKACDGEADEMRFKPGEVVFYGPEGFHPKELQITSGEKVVIHNENIKWEGILVLFVRQQPKKIVKSPVIPVGESEEVTLEQGTYTFFVVEYSPRGKIIVE